MWIYLNQFVHWLQHMWSFKLPSSPDYIIVFSFFNGEKGKKAKILLCTRVLPTLSPDFPCWQGRSSGKQNIVTIATHNGELHTLSVPQGRKIYVKYSAYNFPAIEHCQPRKLGIQRVNIPLSSQYADLLNNWIELFMYLNVYWLSKQLLPWCSTKQIILCPIYSEPLRAFFISFGNLNDWHRESVKAQNFAICVWKTGL